MFRLFHKTDTSGLLSSKLYTERSFYDTFAKDIARAEHSVIIESPYLTERRALQFCQLFGRMSKKGVEILVNTRNPRHHDKTLEIQAWKAMAVLREHKVKVCTYNDMRHRKLGSLNILSQNSSRELMRRTVSKDMCSQVLWFTSIARELRWYNWK
jgi:phosphatidylserine/phosphatidylglycerophosphate/cardiolipin synthase-like enzyme